MTIDKHSKILSKIYPTHESYEHREGDDTNPSTELGTPYTFPRI